MIVKRNKIIVIIIVAIIVIIMAVVYFYGKKDSDTVYTEGISATANNESENQTLNINENQVANNLTNTTNSVNSNESVSEAVNNSSNENSSISKTMSITPSTTTIDGLNVKLESFEDYISTDDTKTPKAGNKFIRMKISIKNTNSSARGVVTSDFKCYANDKIASMVSIATDDRLKSATIKPEKTVTGYLYYEVSSTANQYHVTFNYDQIVGLKAEFEIK